MDGIILIDKPAGITSRGTACRRRSGGHSSRRPLAACEARADRLGRDPGTAKSFLPALQLNRALSEVIIRRKPTTRLQAVHLVFKPQEQCPRNRNRGGPKCCRKGFSRQRIRPRLAPWVRCVGIETLCSTVDGRVGNGLHERSCNETITRQNLRHCLPTSQETSREP